MSRYIIIPLLIATCTSVHAQQPAPPLPNPQISIDQGRAHATGSTTSIRSNINGTGVTSLMTELVPGYTASPTETSLGGLPILSSTASARLAACRSIDRLAASAAMVANCDALLQTYDAAAAPKPPIPQPEVDAARGIPPASISSTYGACTTQTRLVSNAVYDYQSCHQYLLRELDQPCQKDLSVTVDWVCPAGSTTAYGAREIDANGNPRWTCQQPVQEFTYQCQAPNTGPTIVYVSIFPQHVCTTPQGGQIPATTVLTTRYEKVDAYPVENDTWYNGCTSYESRVPPGLLPPDGQELAADAKPVGEGPVNKCERKASVCSGPGTWAVINDWWVYRPCWQFTNTFNCVTNDSRSDCDQPRPASCSEIGQRACIDTDSFIKPPVGPVCTAYQRNFQCLVRPAVYQTVENCTSQQHCADGSCFPTGSPPDRDFALFVSAMEAGREAGNYLDQGSLRIFKGAANKCVKKLFGLVNCCNKSGGINIGAFSNLGVLIGAGRAVGGAVGSTYTYDALFASEAPEFVLQGFEMLFGTGGSSALAGLLGGELAVGQFLSTLVPGPWTIAMLVIQYSGLLNCSQKEQVTAMKRDANLCVPVGEYCSRRLPIIKTCLEKSEAFCCFNSRLAKVINVQGRQQLGRGFGSPENPDCSGFSISDLELLDFARMDLSEFYAEIVPKDVNASTFLNGITNRAQQCIANGGRCPP